MVCQLTEVTSIGAIAIDTRKKARLYELMYPLDNPFGVRKLFEDYRQLQEAAYAKGDYDAIDVLIDFERALNESNITDRQFQAVYLVCIEKLTQDDAAAEIGVNNRSPVNNLMRRAFQAVAESEGYDEQAFIEWYEFNRKRED